MLRHQKIRGVKRNPSILTESLQVARGNMEDWKITRYGHASKGKDNARIDNEIRESLSRKRITVSLHYVPSRKTFSRI